MVPLMLGQIGYPGPQGPAGNASPTSACWACTQVTPCLSFDHSMKPEPGIGIGRLAGSLPPDEKGVGKNERAGTDPQHVT